MDTSTLSRSRNCNPTVYSQIASYPGSFEREEKEPGRHCQCMRLILLFQEPVTFLTDACGRRKDYAFEFVGMCVIKTIAVHCLIAQNSK